MGRGGKPQLLHVESWPQEHLPDSETTCHFCWCSCVARFSIQMNKVTDTKLGLGSCSAPCCPSDHETGFKSLGSRFLPHEWEGGGEAISATPASQVFAKQGSHQQWAKRAFPSEKGSANTGAPHGSAWALAACTLEGAPGPASRLSPLLEKRSLQGEVMVPRAPDSPADFQEKG